ncbi:MAG: hypothetical protein AAF583_17500 [Pseudomonadota bacterium]
MPSDPDRDRLKKNADGEDQAAAFESLSRFLAPRIQQARDGILSDKSISDIKQDARRLIGL